MSVPKTFFYSASYETKLVKWVFHFILLLKQQLSCLVLCLVSEIFYTDWWDELWIVNCEEWMNQKERKSTTKLEKDFCRRREMTAKCHNFQSAWWEKNWERVQRIWHREWESERVKCIPSRVTADLSQPKKKKRKNVRNYEYEIADRSIDSLFHTNSACLLLSFLFRGIEISEKWWGDRKLNLTLKNE